MINTSNTAAGAELAAWHIDHNQLLPGDVFLESGDRLVSAAIRRFDQGDFSHALIWAGNTDFIEATGDGVRVISFARVLIADPDRWRWLRHPDANLARAAATEARNLTHMPYGLFGALATKSPVPFAPSRTRLFCSQLVAEAYSRAGTDLVSGKRPSDVAPNDLLRESSLDDFGRPPLVPIQLTSEDAWLLDRDRAYKESAPAKELLITKAAFGAVDHLTDRFRPRPGSLAALLQALANSPADNSDLADALLYELEERGYFSLLEPLMVAESQNPHRGPAYDQSLRESAQRHQDQWRAYMKLSEQKPYPLWKRFAKLHVRAYSLLLGLAE